MRILAVSRLILAVACAASPIAGAAAAVSQALFDPMPPAATVTIGGDCRARWNGEPVADEQILDRSVAVLEAGIESIGGVENVTEHNIPYLRLEAPPETPWRCLAPALLEMQRSGMAWVDLHDQRANFAWGGQERSEPPVYIELQADGRLAWNRQPVDADALRGRVRDMGDDARIPDNLVLFVGAEAAFGEVHQLLRTLNDAGGVATLAICGGPFAPPRAELSVCEAASAD